MRRNRSCSGSRLTSLSTSWSSGMRCRASWRSRRRWASAGHRSLTALKVLGIIQSKRKGGIRIVRNPVLLDLRHYFTDSFDSKARYDDAMEFRAAMDWGLAPLMLARIPKKTIRALRRLLDEVAAGDPKTVDFLQTEVEFHTLLTVGCGNRMARLLGHMYAPIFHRDAERSREKFRTTDYPALWLKQHSGIVDALESRDAEAFLAALKEHTHIYMRSPRASSRNAGRSTP